MVIKMNKTSGKKKKKERKNKKERKKKNYDLRTPLFLLRPN